MFGPSFEGHANEITKVKVRQQNKQGWQETLANKQQIDDPTQRYEVRDVDVIDRRKNNYLDSVTKKVFSTTNIDPT